VRAQGRLCTKNRKIGSPVLPGCRSNLKVGLAIAAVLAVLTALPALLTALAALLAALPTTLAGPVLTAALLLLAGFLLAAATLLLVALRIALALLLSVLRIVLPWIVRHWTFSSHLRVCGEDSPLAHRTMRRGARAFPSRGA
jgi:hypothetical protein